MEIDLLMQATINGIVSGLMYAMVAIGLSLIFGVSRILFFCHGEVFMLSGIVGYFLAQLLGVPYVPALIATALLMGGFGIILERLFRPLQGQELPTIIVAIALGMIIAQVALLLFGSSSYGIPFLSHTRVQLFGLTFAGNRLVIIPAALALVLGLFFFIQRTRIGKAMRAIAQDKETAEIHGIDTNRSVAITFFLSTALAGAAAILIAPISCINVFSGPVTLSNAFIVVMLGGLGSFPGALLGGLLLGFVSSFGSFFIADISTLIGFVIVILVLLVRPRGFFGRE
jgi:branched-chain amino acid transport system permease protein